MTTAVCRVCLAGDARLLCIDNSKVLQDTYEKLSSTKLKPGDEWPEMLCYICHSQLQRCRRFMIMCQKCNKILSDLFQKGIEVTHDTYIKLNLETTYNLSVPPMQFIELNSNSKRYIADVSVKEQFIETEEETEDAVTNACFEDERPLINESESTLNKKDIDEQFLCKVCGGKFITNRELAEHLLAHTEIMQNDTFNNKESCRKTSTSKRTVKKHEIKSHTAEKQYACDSCEKSYTHKNSLKEHKRVHTGEKPYVCDICNKAFIYKQCVRMHMRIHTGEKPYSCDICKKTFICKQALTSHMIHIHTKEKPHQCESCDRAFPKKLMLQTHIRRTHTGQKPYTCQICNKAFAQKSTLYMASHMAFLQCGYALDGI